MRYDKDILGLVKRLSERLDDRVRQILDEGWNMTNDRIISKLCGVE